VFFMEISTLASLYKLIKLLNLNPQGSSAESSFEVLLERFWKFKSIFFFR